MKNNQQECQITSDTFFYCPVRNMSLSKADFHFLWVKFYLPMQVKYS